MPNTFKKGDVVMVSLEPDEEPQAMRVTRSEKRESGATDLELEPCEPERGPSGGIVSRDPPFLCLAPADQPAPPGGLIFGCLDDG